ncbi:scavenger receptor cysteine-rich type 1 protein M130-like [Exaiptasia diaphana]|uniref:SRCR domain-containing protein n=1 Tax=Exaiptasia diaphana TaxID=2652724 RepID=A0A913YIC9_EXADI|nr:scavenger receptor cysteine-rich type 1 protein M130-like [Exaiptasia diaphana]
MEKFRVNVILVWLLAVYTCCAFGTAPLRLLQKQYPSPSLVQGILQIYHDGQWGTICDDNWDMTDTNIACKQLGYGSAVNYKHLGEGPDPIWLDGVNCNGGESSLDQCQHEGWGKHDCSHSEDVGIVCKYTTPPLRLLGKLSTPSVVQGILQIYFKHQWGTICDDYWDMTNTNITCKQLGYERAVRFMHLGRGSDPIWLDEVQCNGNESTLDKCPHKALGVHNCDHSEDVGIVCYTGPPVKVRLIGDVPNAGRVQLLYKGVWKNLCQGYWSSNPAKVICRMAGYPDGYAVRMHQYKGSNDVWLSSYSCNGFEPYIELCLDLIWGKATCSDNNLAGVVCKSGSPNVSYRLIGSVPHAGRLEMRYYGSWMPVYSQNGLGLNDAHVICRMMGYNQAIIAFINIQERRSSYEVDMSCRGFENTTEQCGNSVSTSNNQRRETTWIVCKPHTESRFAVRFMDGMSLNEGRVEIGSSGVWGSLNERYRHRRRFRRWGLTAANIVCHSI